MDYLKARQRRQRSQRWHLFCKTLTAARLRTAKSIVGFGARHSDLITNGRLRNLVKSDIALISIKVIIKGENNDVNDKLIQQRIV